ncbi:hypothetical protein ACIKTA_04610, partial [Hansschlegelia beijingensis]
HRRVALRFACWRFLELGQLSPYEFEPALKYARGEPSWSGARPPFRRQRRRSGVGPWARFFWVVPSFMRGLIEPSEP